MTSIARHNHPACASSERRRRLRAINASVDSARRASPTYGPHACEAPWAKYTTTRRPGWTWEPPVRQRFRPFDTVGEQIILALCVSMMLVLFVFMA